MIRFKKFKIKLFKKLFIKFRDHISFRIDGDGMATFFLLLNGEYKLYDIVREHLYIKDIQLEDNKLVITFGVNGIA